MSDTLWGKPVKIVPSLPHGKVTFGTFDQGAVSLAHIQDKDAVKEMCRKCNATIRVYAIPKRGEVPDVYTVAVNLCSFCQAQELQARTP